MKYSIKKILIICICLLCMLIAIPVSATSVQGTEGNELQVLQPSNLEVQLGTKWVGVEFVLRTDAGMYPGTIVVDKDGTLKLEIGGSKSYILSCLQSDVLIPAPEPSEILTQAPATYKDDNKKTSDTEAPDEDTGIPNWAITIFVLGILFIAVVVIIVKLFDKYEQKNESDDNKKQG